MGDAGKKLETPDGSLATKSVLVTQAAPEPVSRWVGGGVETCSGQGTELLQTAAQKALILQSSEPLAGCG